MRDARLARTFGALLAAGAAAGIVVSAAAQPGSSPALATVRPGGMTMAMDSSDVQRKSFTPGKAYPGVIMRGGKVSQDNDWNTGVTSGSTGQSSAPALPAVPLRSAPAPRLLTTAPLRFLGTADGTGPDTGLPGKPASAGPAMLAGAVRVVTPGLSFLGTGPGAGVAPSLPVQRKSVRTAPLDFIGPPQPRP